MRDIADWLNRIGFGQFADAFESNGIDFDLLEKITNDDLKDIGIAKLADRKRLLEEIGRFVQQRTQTAGDRRLLTVLFSDLVGSTTLSQQLDPEELRQALRRYQETALNSITKHGGVVANNLGDGVMAYFGWPRADEDQARQAVRAGLDTIDAVAEIKSEVGVELRCRVGIATGRVVVGGEGQLDSAFGETLNLAARLQSVADEDRLVIDKVTRHMIGHGFQTKPLGLIALKGFEQPVEVWEANQEQKYLDRFESLHEGSSQFAGRDDELRILMQNWQSIDERRGRTFVVKGDAGIGKSRLVREFELAIGPDHPVLRYQCSPYHANSAFYPVIQHIEKAAGFSQQGEPASEKLAKVASLFEDVTSDDPKTLGLLAELLSIPQEQLGGLSTLSAAQRREFVIAALVEQAVRLSKRSAVLVLLEDAHWIDPSSLELLQELIKRTTQERVFTLVTTRPGRDLQLPGATIELVLARLSDADIEAIAKSMRGAGALSDGDVATIVARVDGIPLFAEEFTSTILDHKADDHRRSLPENIQASVMARLDGLGDARFVAQVGSVIGREFTRAQLSALTGESPADLETSIVRLVNSGLLLAPNAPDKNYSFKHALVRDVAYESLLREQRRKLHARAVREVISDDEKERMPELVAHHLTEAGLIVEALEYWKKAGYRASRASAHSEAIAHFTKGLALIRELPGDGSRDRLELEFQVGLIGPLIASTGYTSEELKAVIARALELSKKVDNAPEIFPVLYSRWSFLLTSGSISESFDVAQEFSNLAERQGNQDALYARYRMLGASRMCLGELEEATRDIERAISLYVKEEHERLLTAYGVDIRVAARCFLGEVLWLKGYPDSARQSTALALKEAKDIGHTHSVAMSLFFCSLVSLLCWDHDAVRNYTGEMSELASRQAIGGWPVLGRSILGWSLVAGGNPDQGLALMNEGMDLAQKNGVLMFVPILKCRQAEVLLSLDRALESERAVAEAEAIINRTGERNYEGELRRLKGEMHRRNGQPEEAESEFREALETARRQKAKSIELRVAISYVQLLAAQGQKDVALELITRVKAEFEEGWGGHDLGSAQAAVEALRGAVR